MERNVSLDGIRNNVFDRIEKSERNFKLAFFGAVFMEVLFLVGYALLSDFHNRLHLLLFLSTLTVYTIVCLGLAALGAFVGKNTQRLLQAIDSLCNDS